MTKKTLPTCGPQIMCWSVAGLLAAGFASPASAQVAPATSATAAQPAASPAVMARIANVLQEKESRNATQQKIGSQLWYALQASRGQAMADLGAMYSEATAAVGADTAGRVEVSIRARVSDGLLARIAAAGGTVRFASVTGGSIAASVPLAAVERLAAHPDVVHVAPAERATTHVGAVTSQGYIGHKANQVLAKGIDGTGVKVGVLSDSAQYVNTLIASGDLPADTIVVPYQDGNGYGGNSEGSAMMEIVHDLAPGAKLVFATAYGGSDNFANNIRTLRNTYGCDIIVDDVTYFDEGVFQDDNIARAVNDVVASGALYLSSAANSGSVTAGTSGTWEGDFASAGASSAPLPAGYQLHDFGGGQAYDVLTASTTYISFKWADPLAHSTNDYDLFVLSADGTSILCASTDLQGMNGANPKEGCSSSTGWPVNSRIVLAKKSGAAALALHLDTERGRLSIATTGATIGHNAGSNTVSMAATYWNSAKTGTKPFVGGAANPTEAFSSDGPRKIFFNPDGTPITPGNFKFASHGGTTVAKPDLTAADGVSTKTPGFAPFFGTSAAAPHAAAIAALIKSARPDYTNQQILNAMKATALDIRAPGVDRDAGSGIVMGIEAVNYAIAH